MSRKIMNPRQEDEEHKQEDDELEQEDAEHE